MLDRSCTPADLHRISAAYRPASEEVGFWCRCVSEAQGAYARSALGEAAISRSGACVGLYTSTAAALSRTETMLLEEVAGFG